MERVGATVGLAAAITSTARTCFLAFGNVLKGGFALFMTLRVSRSWSCTPDAEHCLLGFGSHAGRWD